MSTRRWTVLGLTLFALGFFLQVWLWNRGRIDLRAPSQHGQIELCGIEKYGDHREFTEDQVNLLGPGLDLVRGGKLGAFSKRMTGGAIVPGALLQILIGGPLKIVFDYRAASSLLLLLHFGAGLLVWKVGDKTAGRRFAVLWLGLFWLSPWRIFHSGFLWEPAYMFLPSVAHLWATWKASTSAHRGASLVLGMVLTAAPQLHASALVLLVMTLLLAWRRHIRWHLPSFVSGIVIGGLTLIPTVLAWLNGDLEVTREAETDIRFPGHSLPRALLYWVRIGSLDLGRRMRQTRFFEDAKEDLFEPAALMMVVLVILATFSVVLSLWASWRYLRASGVDADLPAGRRFLHTYARSAFVAFVVIGLISPFTLQGWHLVVALPAACLPVAAGIETMLQRGRHRGRKLAVLLVALLAVQLAIALALGLAHPMYAEPVGACVAVTAPN